MSLTPSPKKSELNKKHGFYSPTMDKPSEQQSKQETIHEQKGILGEKR